MQRARRDYNRKSAETKSRAVYRRMQRAYATGVCAYAMLECNAMQKASRVERLSKRRAWERAKTDERTNERANEDGVLRTHRSWWPFYPPSLQHTSAHTNTRPERTQFLRHPTPRLTTSLSDIATKLGLSHLLHARHGASPDTPPVIQTLSGPSPIHPCSHVLVPSLSRSFSLIRHPIWSLRQSIPSCPSEPRP